MKANNEDKDSSNKGFNGGQNSSAEEYSLMQKSNDGGILGSKE